MAAESSEELCLGVSATGAAGGPARNNGAEQLRATFVGGGMKSRADIYR